MPLAYRSVRVHGRLPADVRSCVTKCERVDAGGDIYSVDVSICTPEGQVVVEVTGFQMKRLGPGQEFQPSAAEGAAAELAAELVAAGARAAGERRARLPPRTRVPIVFWLLSFKRNCRKPANTMRLPRYRN